jgi:hypothetical protein
VDAILIGAAAGAGGWNKQSGDGVLVEQDTAAAAGRTSDVCFARQERIQECGIGKSLLSALRADDTRAEGERMHVTHVSDPPLS